MQQFFQQFTINPQQAVIDTNTPELKHNLLVMEMYNNWPFVRCMMFKHREGKLPMVDAMENEWIQFILQNNIDAEADKTGDDFFKANLKELVNDEKK